VDYDNFDDAVDRKQAIGTIVFALYLVAMGVILSEKDSLREWAWASMTLGILLLLPRKAGNLLVRLVVAMLVAMGLLLLFRAGQFLLGS
jgi:hypothetical protein